MFRSIITRSSSRPLSSSSLSHIYTANNIRLVNFSLTDINDSNKVDFRQAVITLKSNDIFVGIVSRHDNVSTLSTLESFKIHPSVYSYKIYDNMKKTGITVPRQVIFAGSNIVELKNAQGNGVYINVIKDTNELMNLVDFVVKSNL